MKKANFVPDCRKSESQILAAIDEGAVFAEAANAGVNGNERDT